MLNTTHHELRRWWRRMTTSVWRMPKHVRWRWSSFIIHSHIWTKKKTLLSFKTLLIIKWSRMLKNFYPMMLCWFIWTRKSNSECKINFLQHTHKKKQAHLHTMQLSTNILKHITENLQEAVYDIHKKFQAWSIFWRNGDIFTRSFLFGTFSNEASFREPPALSTLSATLISCAKLFYCCIWANFTRLQ